MASVRKRTWTNNGEEKTAWVVQWKAQDQKNKTKTFKKKKDADRFRTSIEMELQSGVFADQPRRMKFSELFQAYRDYRRLEIERGVLRRQTWDRQDYSMEKYILPHLAHMNVQEANQRMVDDALSMIFKGKKGSTCRLHRCYVGNFFEFGVHRGLLAKNYIHASRIRTPSASRRKEPVSDSDVKALFAEAAVPRRDAAATTQSLVIVGLAALAGLRACEIAGLRWSDIDFGADNIYVRRGVDQFGRIGDTKNDQSERDVPISPELKPILQAHHREVGGGNYVARSQASKDTHVNPRHVSQRVRELIVNAGLIDDAEKPRFSLHDLRHYAASWMLRDGVPVPAVSKMLGHAHPGVTMKVYAHALPGDNSVRMAMERRANA